MTVQLVDSGGNPVATSGVSVTLALGNNSGSGTLSGTLTEPTNASGVATFSDLSIDEPGLGYTLTASSTGLTGATSNPFSESNSTSTTCTTSPCTTDLGTSVSDLEISADASAGTINESVDVGSPLTCPNQRSSFDSNFYGFSETGTADKTLTYELFGLNSDQISEVEICFGAPYEFVNSDGGEAASGTLPDGSPGFVDLLPNCSDGIRGHRAVCRHARDVLRRPFGLAGHRPYPRHACDGRAGRPAGSTAKGRSGGRRAATPILYEARASAAARSLAAR